jgi:hypothetical protein
VLEGQLENKAAGVLEGEIDGETTGVIEGELKGETVRVFQGESDRDGETTRVFPDNEQASTSYNQPNEAASEEQDGESDSDEDEFHEEIADIDVCYPDTMMTSVQRI